jgi:hypothetical protein
VLLSHLHPDTSVNDLEKEFGQFGKINDIQLTWTGATIEYVDESSVANAVSVPHNVLGQKISVEPRLVKEAYSSGELKTCMKAAEKFPQYIGLIQRYLAHDAGDGLMVLYLLVKKYGLSEQARQEIIGMSAAARDSAGIYPGFLWEKYEKTNFL